MSEISISIDEFDKALQLYGNFFCALEVLPTKAERYDMIYALWRFGVRGEIPEFDNPRASGIFYGLAGSVVAGNKKYIANVENGRKGGAPKKKKISNYKQDSQTTNGNKDQQIPNNLGYNPNELGFSVSLYPKKGINKEMDKSINKEIDLSHFESSKDDSHSISPSGDGNAPDGHSAPSGNTPVSKSGINWQEMTWQEEFELFEKYFNEQIEKYHLREVVTEEGPAYLSNEILCPYTKEEMRNAFRRGMDFKEYHEWDGMEDNT